MTIDRADLSEFLPPAHFGGQGDRSKLSKMTVQNSQNGLAANLTV